MRKLIAVLSVSVLSLMALSQVAFAGEYSPGNGGDAARDKFYDDKASVCSFNGADQPDDGDNPEDHGDEPGDDEMWGATPAGGKVQSGGQIVASFATAGPGAVAGAVAADEFSGFGDDCQMKFSDFIGEPH